MTAAPPTQPDLKSALEEMRASMAARGPRKGVAGAIQEAILGFLSVLLAMLEDFRAGRLAPVAPVAEAAGEGGVSAVAPPPPRTFLVEGGGGGRGGANDREEAQEAEPNSRRFALYGLCSDSDAQWIAGADQVEGRGPDRGAGSGCEAAHSADGGSVSRETEDVWAEACPSPSRIGRHFSSINSEPAGAALPRPQGWGFGASSAVRSSQVFFKNAILGEGISAGFSFQYQNDLATAGR